MIVLEHAYHGNTTTLIDISPYKHDGPGGSGPPAWVHKVSLYDAQEVEEVVKRLSQWGKGFVRIYCGVDAECRGADRVAGRLSAKSL